eukprot:556934-Rhodomonas_salina.2
MSSDGITLSIMRLAAPYATSAPRIADREGREIPRNWRVREGERGRDPYVGPGIITGTPYQG